MPAIYSTTFTPSAGKTVELPENIGRKDAFRYGGGKAGRGSFEVSVVGRGELGEYVILEASEGASTVPEGAVVLATDVATSTIYYAVPKEVYE